MNMEDTECSETPARKIKTPGNDPPERTLHSQYGTSLQSRMSNYCCNLYTCVYVIK